ncbi:MAG: hypothetical protein KDD66_04895 [Bdellovibrionales bacterium]|nr:hypothetical protein [Bdellovibrionales bacterium]
MSEQLQKSTACFKFNGGISVGPKWWWTLNLPWPIGAIEISNAQIAVSYLGARQVFERENVTCLELVRRFLITGVQLKHTEQSNSKFVLFSTLAAKRVLAHAEYLGYPVKS